MNNNALQREIDYIEADDNLSVKEKQQRIADLERDAAYYDRYGCGYSSGYDYNDNRY